MLTKQHIISRPLEQWTPLAGVPPRPKCGITIRQVNWGLFFNLTNHGQIIVQGGFAHTSPNCSSGRSTAFTATAWWWGYLTNCVSSIEDEKNARNAWETRFCFSFRPDSSRGKNLVQGGRVQWLAGGSNCMVWALKEGMERLSDWQQEWLSR